MGYTRQSGRMALGDEACFRRFLGYSTAAFIIDVLGQLPVAHDAFSTMTVPGRQVGIYPIRGGRLATFFVHEAERILNDFSHESMLEELRTAYDGLDWIVPEFLDQSRGVSDVYFDSVVQIEMPRWSRGRVVLVGDACQCVSLIVGQGASLAMIGAYLLAQELCAVGDDVAGARAQYERKLKPSVEEKQAAGRRLARWFVPEHRRHPVIRDAVLWMITVPGVSEIIGRSFSLASAIKL
jgi:2-polyprenyl-6-methoxyphenol hydroxylase-like FAD-dependent oxidoreductase